MVVGNDEFRRFVKLHSQILNMVVEGKREPNEVAVILQAVNDSKDFAVKFERVQRLGLLKCLLEAPNPQIVDVEKFGRMLGLPSLAERAEKAAAEVSPTRILVPYPADFKVFEMTLDGDLPENQPLEMVRRDGYDNPSKWQHNGPIVKGTQTARFMSVSIGYQLDFDSVRRACNKHGQIPEGQWREAVKQMFQPDGAYRRGIADSSWVDPSGSARFPFVFSVGRSFFGWSDDGFFDDWRWLVLVSK